MLRAVLHRAVEVVEAAVKQDGRALELADPALACDTGIALAAVAENGHALQYVDQKLKVDTGLKVLAFDAAIERLYLVSR